MGNFTGWRDIYGRPSDEPATKAAEWRETHRRLRSATLTRNPGLSKGWLANVKGDEYRTEWFPTLAEAWAFLEQECATFGVALEAGE